MFYERPLAVSGGSLIHTQQCNCWCMWANVCPGNTAISMIHPGQKDRAERETIIWRSYPSKRMQATCSSCDKIVAEIISSPGLECHTWVPTAVGVRVEWARQPQCHSLSEWWHQHQAKRTLRTLMTMLKSKTELLKHVSVLLPRIQEEHPVPYVGVHGPIPSPLIMASWPY